MNVTILYLAGGLFNAGARLHNQYLEKYLKKLGYEVILPQREALKYFKDGVLDLTQTAEACWRTVSDPGVLTVVNIDGPDADSGAVVEFAIAMTKTGRAIVYRTDSRTDADREVGVNAMLLNPNSTFIYHPCFITEMDEIEPYFRVLAERIHLAVREIQNR